MHKQSRYSWLLYIAHLLIIGIIVFPLLFGLVSSFRPLEDIFKYVSPVSWKTFIPIHFTFDAYVNLFVNRGFDRILLNTFFVTVVSVVFGLFVGSLAAFAFAMFKFAGKNVLFGIVLLTFMIPFEVIAIPLYKLVNSFGWIDTYFGLIVPGIANGLVIFLYRQFYMEIPPSLVESARVDGASWARIYAGIIMPLSKAVTVSGILLIFIQQWESFMWPLIATRSKAYRVLQVALSDFVTEAGTYWNELFAAALISVIIPVVVLLPLQRYFVKGVSTTGSKE